MEYSLFIVLRIQVCINEFKNKPTESWLLSSWLRFTNLLMLMDLQAEDRRSTCSCGTQQDRRGVCLCEVVWRKVKGKLCFIWNVCLFVHLQIHYVNDKLMCGVAKKWKDNANTTGHKVRKTEFVWPIYFLSSGFAALQSRISAGPTACCCCTTSPVRGASLMLGSGWTWLR